MPDIGTGLMSAFSSVETPKPASAGAPGQFTAPRTRLPGFEPMILPPAKSLANFYAALAALASGSARSRSRSCIWATTISPTTVSRALCASIW